MHTLSLQPWRLCGALFLSGAAGLLAACGGNGDALTPGDITVQPQSSSATAGGSVTFSVAAVGNGLTYQWQRSVDGGLTWSGILSAIAASYTISAVDWSLAGNQYRTVVSDGHSTVTTAAATLKVTGVPLQPRASGAAYYHPQLDATLIADANLPASLPLGVSGIAADGTMNWPTAQAWVRALNAANYLGHNDWRLPTVMPINGVAFQFNSLPSDPQGNAGKIDLGYNISAPGTQYAGSTASELPFLFYNALGSVAKVSPSGAAQSVAGNTNLPLHNVATGNYWTGQSYGSTGAMAFDMQNGSQYSYVADSWAFHVLVLRNGDIAP